MRPSISIPRIWISLRGPILWLVSRSHRKINGFELDPDFDPRQNLIHPDLRTNNCPSFWSGFGCVSVSSVSFPSYDFLPKQKHFFFLANKESIQRSNKRMISFVYQKLKIISKPKFRDREARRHASKYKYKLSSIWFPPWTCSRGIESEILGHWCQSLWFSKGINDFFATSNFFTHNPFLTFNCAKLIAWPIPKS